MDGSAGVSGGKLWDSLADSFAEVFETHLFISKCPLLLVRPFVDEEQPLETVSTKLSEEK